MAKTDLTVEFVRSLFHYDPETGRLWRKWKTFARLLTGTSSNGYVIAGANGRNYQAHRVIWLWVYGVWPSHDIDHIDGNRANNSLSNLRAVSRSVNAQNLKKHRADNKAGLMGVRLDSRWGSKRWYAQISVGGKKRFLGSFRSPQQAHEAYLTAKRCLHEGNTL